jgi:peptidoglycan/xylan/chitin deacetylase (PgdA/CDA1 family)
MYTHVSKKRLMAAVSLVGLVAGVLTQALPAFADTSTNLIANAGFETANGAVPASWSSDYWGTNTAKFTYDTTGHAGSRAGSVTVSGYKSGDAKWFPTPVTVTPGVTYTFSNWYKSTAVSGLDAVVGTTTGTTSYTWLASPVVSSAWKQQTFTFTAPANAKTVTFYQYLEKNGTLSVDDYSLTSSVVTPPPVNVAPTVSIATPAANAAVSGAVSLSANAADDKGVAKVQFQIDGANFGSAATAAPYTASWDSKTVADGAHTVAAIATDTDGVSTTSTKVNVTVSNPVTPPPTDPTPPVTPPATGNLIANPSVETASGTAPANWTNDGWGTNTRSMTYESNGEDGARSLKATVSAYTSGDAKWYFTPVTVTPGAAYSYGEWYKSSVATEVDAMVTMKDGTTQWLWLGSVPANATAWQKLNLQFTAPANASKVTIMHIISGVGYVQTDNFNLSAYAPSQFNRGLVTLTFDDGWRSIYTSGLPALKKYGLTSTQYLNSTPIVDGYPDYMTYQMVKDFATAGHELAWHTRTHADITTLTAAKLTTELTIPTNFLTGIGKSATDFKNFASPYGAYNASSVSAVMAKYQSHRSTDVGYNSKDSFTPTNIKVQNITNTTTPAEVKAWVDQAIASKTWLVIVYHEVTDTAEDPTYAVTPANLDAELNYVKQSGATVKTLDAAMTEVKSQL